MWEALSAGVGPAASPPASLRREGLAMLLALVDDLLRIDGVTVSTILAEPLPETPPGLCVARPAHSTAERDLFRRLARDSDACWLIAPETGGLLAERIRIAEDAGANCCNCTPAAVELCGDKLALCAFLWERDIPVVQTRLFADGPWPADVGFPCVLKPRDGAGSDGCRRIDSPRELSDVTVAPGTVVQPFLAGAALSTAALVGNSRHTVLPVGRQLIDETTLYYLGGQVPAAIPPAAAGALTNVVHSCRGALDGLRGYVGFDFVLPDDDPLHPVLLEINPRLTTAYVGYRQLTRENLAERILFPERRAGDVTWSDGSVRFDSRPRQRS